VSGAAVIRPARASDLEEILVLCAEHATFERASFQPDGARGPLARLLFGEPPRLWCLLADVEAEAGGALAGYATFALELSTWRAAQYVHMDCLYVREGFRNAGIGSLLLRRVAEAAEALECDFVEWQTPSWNRDAIRFYDRAGAVRSEKMRYNLATVASAHSGLMR
jgi:ribosomal protein S18 acetylase RimI-like enzyme